MTLHQRAKPDAPAAARPIALAIEQRHPWRLLRRGPLTLAFAGHAFNITPEALLDAIAEWPDASAERLGAFAANVDGHFAFAAVNDGWAVAAVDRVRSIPLFLAQHEGGWRVDNEAQRLSRAVGFGVADLDRTAALEIAMAGYTIDTATLYRGLVMPGPGECVVVRPGGEAGRHRYYTYSPWRVIDGDAASLKRRLAEVTLAIVDKHLKSLDGRPLVVPLSAGFDSRLVVSAARHLGYRNVRSFSYGRAGNFEADTARAIAAKLDIPWRFVHCTVSGQRAYFESCAHADYLAYADSCASVPFEQDATALMRLKADGFVPAEAVIANGNSGDYISGNHILPKLRQPLSGLSESERRDRIFNALVEKHFALWGHLATRANTARVRQALEASVARAGASLSGPATDHGLYEYAEFQDRQCKYVITGQRVYEFLGHDWRLPLWDNDYLDFWQSVPLCLKAGQALYADMLHEQNWGGVWRDIPVNRKTIRPLWLVPFRLAAKAAHAPLGAARWHRFERQYFGYWIDNTCNAACVPYRRVALDRRRARLSVSWLAEQYLAAHGVSLDELAGG